MTAYAELEAVLLALGCASSDVINASVMRRRMSIEPEAVRHSTTAAAVVVSAFAETGSD